LRLHATDDLRTLYYTQLLRANPIIVRAFSGKPRAGGDAEKKIKFPGRYALYSVAQRGDNDNELVHAVVTRVDLAEGRCVRFWFSDQTGDGWSGYTGSDLKTVAGQRQLHLGPASQYYWAMEQYWDEYWKKEPARKRNELLLGIMGLFAPRI
jgi:hypothetical protein